MDGKAKRQCESGADSRVGSTRSPRGSAAMVRGTHVSQHVAAVTHAYESTDLRPTGDEGMTPTVKTGRRAQPGRRAKPLLGVRRQPGRLALAVFRLPLPLYQRGWGWLLGHTFLLVTHAGRKTGKRRETVAMTLAYDPQTQEAVIFSGWGPNTDWIRNIRAHPALQIQIGRESYTPNNASSPRTRASPWWSSSDASIAGAYASPP